MITLITGTMWGGKSTRLAAIRESGVNCDVYLASPKLEGRVGIATHDGGYIPATEITHYDQVASPTTGRAIMIDEVQWLPPSLWLWCRDIAQRKWPTDLYLAGLLHDYQGQAFSTVAALMPWADKIEICRGRCHRCGETAHHHIRLTGQTERYVYSSEVYELRCHDCVETEEVLRRC